MLNLSSRRLIPLLCIVSVFILALVFHSSVFAQEDQPGAAQIQPSAPAFNAEEIQQLEEKLDGIRSQLANIARSIQERRDHLDDLRNQAAVAQTASEREELEIEIAELERLIQTSRSTFESIATGGYDSGIFRDSPDESFDWQQEFFELIQPFLEQIKQITETPRSMERLKREIAESQARLNVVNRALANLAVISATVHESHVRQRLEAVEKSWLQRQSDLQLEIELSQLQLQELRQEQETFWSMLQQGMLSFVQGRGLILILALALALGTWFLLQSLPKLTRRGTDNQIGAKRKPYARLMTIGYQAFCVLLSLCVLVLVLYVSGDWLLLGLAIIILVLVIVGSRTYLPRFMTEMRMLLDMGPVREGERILLNGIPWEVKNLNMYSTLVNPELHGGVLRRPLGELADMVSRPDEPDEPWFPTRKDDFVLLSDGTYGQVLLQTPEVVQLKHIGSVRTFSTTSFLGSSPRNLTRNGFGFAVTFGIDYQHQAICLDQVPGIFEAAVTEALKTSFAEGLESVLVDFKEAGASSLDYLIYVMMRGSAAGSYWAVGRIIQQACVQVCNERGWIIPFTQLTVHQGEGFEALRTARN